MEYLTITEWTELLDNRLIRDLRVTRSRVRRAFKDIRECGDIPEGLEPKRERCGPRAFLIPRTPVWKELFEQVIRRRASTCDPEKVEGKYD